MSGKYNNEEYRDLVNEFLGEAFYLPGLSYGTKIQKIRQYTEIIIRRLLNYPCDKNIEIGNTFTQDNLSKCGCNENWFRDALEVIRSGGNERTHTKWRRVAQEEEYERILNALFDLYGYLFYRYFKRYEFGSNPDIVTAFSILPPIIRHITLKALYQDMPSNTWVIEKLTLAKIKSFSIEEASRWVEENKAFLLLQPAQDLLELKNHLATIMGEEMAAITVAGMPQNMYEFCCSKLKTVGASIAASGPLYSDFETAKAYYTKHGIVSGSTKPISEFNDLMEFVYMGRREKELQIVQIPEDDYLINQVVIINPKLWNSLE